MRPATHGTVRTPRQKSKIEIDPAEVDIVASKTGDWRRGLAFYRGYEFRFDLRYHPAVSLEEHIAAMSNHARLEFYAATNPPHPSTENPEKSKR
jgi:hypothetical protein